MRVGFVAKRIAGTDGVSLEVAKWAEILERMGHTCFYIAGECDRPASQSQIIPEAHFKHRVIRAIDRDCFGRQIRSMEVSAAIHEMAWVIKEKLHSALTRFELDLIIAENCLTIPMNIPLGLALVETVMETGIGCIAHHHDFYWERERFLVNAAEDYLLTAFPPALPQIHHVVINSQAAREFSRRTGLPCRTIPNVMDFDRRPSPRDSFSSEFRAAVGLGKDDIVVLQATRVVARKGIEHSVELVRQLEDPRVKLVLTHPAGDEGDAYAKRIRKYAELLGVELVFADSCIATARVSGANGEKRFTIADAYQNADLVTYPSSYEGFGNAFLEAIYYRKPILCNRYAIYRTDIEPCGFDAILMDQFLTEEVLDQVRRVLADADLRTAMVEKNYAIARQYFSYQRVEDELRALFSKPHLASACDPKTAVPKVRVLG